MFLSKTRRGGPYRLLAGLVFVAAALVISATALAAAAPAPRNPPDQPMLDALVQPSEPVEVAGGPVYCVVDIPFAGPVFGPTDAPATTVELTVRFKHQSGSPVITVHGFWDGDGAGGTTGGVFRVRFCPTLAGKWFLAEVRSNQSALNGQKTGGYVTAIPSGKKGFWMPDRQGPGSRWYARSDGSHAYIVGNTHYSFLSEHRGTGLASGDFSWDIANNAKYFNKLRFSVVPDRYPHPTSKPFLDNTGRPTDDGDYSSRPNPAWIHHRVDSAVRTAFDHDVIADLILNGPDTSEARSVLRAAQSGGDPTPFLHYIAARYGSYPNVWLCLSNEWNIGSPSYEAADIARFGQILRKFLPYPTPVSVHPNHEWDKALNSSPPWNDHVIVQGKIKTLAEAADFAAANRDAGGLPATALAAEGGMPVVNDELAYQGDGDGFSREDVIEGFVGTFLGGGYGTTGFKPAAKRGPYFWGKFNPAEHTAADHLLWLRTKIDSNFTFWKMKPVDPRASVFPNANPKFRAMAWPDHEYVIGTDEAQEDIQVKLPPGGWHVWQYDVIAKDEVRMGAEAVGFCTFDAPPSRAVLTFFKKVVPAGTAAPSAR